MDDDSKEFKRNKPQQKLYKPGSGPLRKTSYGPENKGNHYDAFNGGRNRDHYGSKNSIYEEEFPSSKPQNNRNRRQDNSENSVHTSETTTPATSLRGDNSSQFTRKRNDKQPFSNNYGSYGRGAGRRDNKYSDNFSRNFRQASEPRSSSPKKDLQNQDLLDRNRDSRSMETSAGRQAASLGNKPPSGRRNSAGYPSDTFRPKHNILDNIPPRFRKKFLEQSGHHSLDHVDSNRDVYVTTSLPPAPAFNPPNNWSQTLPSRGRGRMRDTDSINTDKILSNYMNSYKSFENEHSRRSTPSSSYMNLYDPSLETTSKLSDNNKKPTNEPVINNGINTAQIKPNVEVPSKEESDSEGITFNSMNIPDMLSLDWTEEVEKEAAASGKSSPSFSMTTSSYSQDIRGPIENKSNETRESKRKSRRKGNRSSSRGQRADVNRRDSNSTDIPHPSTNRERERRDSHRSNRSSTIGNSRDDLDRWRSLRSFSRDQSLEGRIVSQCNSRDTSAIRTLSPRDHDGFRVPLAAPKSSNWNASNQKRNQGQSGRPSSVERGRQSRASNGGGSNQQESSGGGGGGGGKKSKKRSGRNRSGRNSENTAPPPVPVLAPLSIPTTHSSSTNWREEIIESKKHVRDRHDSGRNRLNSCQSDKSESSTHHPGLLVLPQGSLQKEKPREPVEAQKMLYDHHNPSKPIIVQTSPTSVDSRLDRGLTDSWARMCGAVPPDPLETSEALRAARHRSLLVEVDKADAILQTFMLRGPVAIALHWQDVAHTRKFLQNSLQKLLMSDLKYCQADNIEHRFWKILYYSFIEFLRKSLQQLSMEDKPKVVHLINTIIEEGNVFFENLIQMLEKIYEFNTDVFINGNHAVPPKGLGYIGLALIAVQKLYLFLGDLARYKEQVNETNNYAKSKFWYTKAQQINPKNGRPYNQLAILAVYAKRKLDAVYYYMRSLMSSNPFQSARESLISLFDENRKKYEAAERKRRALSDQANPPNENDESGGGKSNRMRREIWIRPGSSGTSARVESKYDDLANMTPVELNKSFITSYLHVHGKLVTKIGMESFHSSAALMLRQFRALLRQQPLPIPGARLLQLTALNMFSVESCSAPTKGEVVAERSAWLECALSVSLLMFGAMVERCCALLPEDAHTQQYADSLLLLPAIKVWSDWMLCHSSKWNPPPSFEHYDTGNENDPWDWLAKLMNILETLDDKTIVFESEMKEGNESVHLAEDAALAGFIPLMYMEPAMAFYRRTGSSLTPHVVGHALRTRKLLFFGTEYLVGVEPPVLKLEYPIDQPPRYVSAVQKFRSRASSLRHLSEESEGEAIESTQMERDSPTAEVAKCSEGVVVADEATRRLLRRKEQLEAKRANMERRREKLQELLTSGSVSVEVEVRPRWLVPDTNCFIEYLHLLQQCLAAPQQPCTLAVPLVVVNELEGLRKCSRVGEKASEALNWLSPSGGMPASGVRFATSRGSLLSSRAFTAEQEQSRTTNDDRVLATALSLDANITNEPDVEKAGASGDVRCVRRVREVVLLTDDRNLRVKALAAELPVRDLPAFLNWAAFPSATHTDNKACTDDAPKHEGDR